MIILVCGGRNYHDYEAVKRALDMLKERYVIDLVIHGDAKGADHLARGWAHQNEIHYAAVPALWGPLGRKAAGPERNRAMLRLRPDMVVAFPGQSGTADMMRAAREQNVTVWEPYK